MKITQRLIPASNTDTRPGIKMVPKYLTIHETDNTAIGADAEAHAELQERGNSRDASWHVQVDDTQAIQSIPFNEVAWAAGDGADGPGNLTSIHLEICVNQDGDFKKAVKNAAEVSKQIIQQFNIPIDHVVQHYKWSGKNCPRYLRSGEKGIDWGDFINMVKTEPKKFFITTGGYTEENVGKILGFLMDNKFWYQPKRKDTGSLEFYIGGFIEGTDSAEKMIKFLDDNNYWYQKQF